VSAFNSYSHSFYASRNILLMIQPSDNVDDEGDDAVKPDPPTHTLTIQF